MVFHYGGRLAYVYDLRAVGSWLLVWLSGFGRVARGQGFGFSVLAARFAFGFANGAAYGWIMKGCF